MPYLFLYSFKWQSLQLTDSTTWLNVAFCQMHACCYASNTSRRGVEHLWKHELWRSCFSTEAIFTVTAHWSVAALTEGSFKPQVCFRVYGWIRHHQIPIPFVSPQIQFPWRSEWKRVSGCTLVIVVQWEWVDLITSTMVSTPLQMAELFTFQKTFADNLLTPMSSKMSMSFFLQLKRN